MYLVSPWFRLALSATICLCLGVSVARDAARLGARRGRLGGGIRDLGPVEWGAFVFFTGLIGVAVFRRFVRPRLVEVQQRENDPSWSVAQLPAPSAGPAHLTVSLPEFAAADEGQSYSWQTAASPAAGPRHAMEIPDPAHPAEDASLINRWAKPSAPAQPDPTPAAPWTPPSPAPAHPQPGAPVYSWQSAAPAPAPTVSTSVHHLPPSPHRPETAGPKIVYPALD